MNILLLFIFSLAVASIILISRIGEKQSFLKVLKVYHIYTICHVCYTAVAINFYSEIRFVDAGAPFALGYGPLLYYGTLTSVRELDSRLRSRIPLHFLSIPFFWIAFVVLLSRPV